MIHNALLAALSRESRMLQLLKEDAVVAERFLRGGVAEVIKRANVQAGVDSNVRVHAVSPEGRFEATARRPSFRWILRLVATSTPADDGVTVQARIGVHPFARAVLLLWGVLVLGVALAGSAVAVWLALRGSPLLSFLEPLLFLCLVLLLPLVGVSGLLKDETILRTWFERVFSDESDP